MTRGGHMTQTFDIAIVGGGMVGASLAVALAPLGLKVALVRHPMPYHDLEAIRVQRFATLAEIDASHPTIEEREEYERPVELGMVMYAGVDYADILTQAQEEADVIVGTAGGHGRLYRPARPAL